MRKRHTAYSLCREKRRFSFQVSITSQTGAGKTTLIKHLKEYNEEPRYTYVSAGQFMRAQAKLQGFGDDIRAFAAYHHEHPEEGMDERCDSYIRECGRKNNTIGEGRLTHVFMPFAFKVLLLCPPHVRAARRMRDTHKPFEVVLMDIVMRDVHDALRYEELYPGCLWPAERFDLVIHTNVVNVDTATRRIYHEHAQWLNKMSSHLIKEATLP